MALLKSKLRSLNIYVKDYEHTIECYEDMGFRIMRTFENKKIRETHMKLSNQSDFMVSIISGDREPGCITLTLDEQFEGDREGKSEFDLKTSELIYHYSEVSDTVLY
jgi:hypothetical protein